MEPQLFFGFKELFTFVIGDMSKAICERPGETKEHHMFRTQVAAQMILGLMPRDVIEAMLAGHSVMFHALMTDSIHDTLRGEVDTMRRGSRTGIIAMNKAFHMNLGKLEHYKARPSQGIRESPGLESSEEAPVPAEATAGETEATVAPAAAPVAAPDAVEQAARPLAPARMFSTSAAQSAGPFRPTAAQIAACRANPEAMAAIDSGDPMRFARAMGIEQPSEAYLAAAAGLPSVIGEPALGGEADTPQTEPAEALPGNLTSGATASRAG